MTFFTSRRRLLAGAAMLATPALIGRARAADGLRMGDQRGNVQAVMQAAGVLSDVPYELTWSEFAAAAPLIEALNNARGRLQHETGQALKLRRVPQLEFYAAGASPFERLPAGENS